MTGLEVGRLHIGENLCLAAFRCVVVVVVVYFWGLFFCPLVFFSCFSVCFECKYKKTEKYIYTYFFLK